MDLEKFIEKKRGSKIEKRTYPPHHAALAEILVKTLGQRRTVEEATAVRGVLPWTQQDCLP